MKKIFWINLFFFLSLCYILHAQRVVLRVDDFSDKYLVAISTDNVSDEDEATVCWISIADKRVNKEILKVQSDDLLLYSRIGAAIRNADTTVIGIGYNNQRIFRYDVLISMGLMILLFIMVLVIMVSTRMLYIWHKVIGLSLVPILPI